MPPSGTEGAIGPSMRAGKSGSLLDLGGEGAVEEGTPWLTLAIIADKRKGFMRRSFHGDTVMLEVNIGLNASKPMLGIAAEADDAAAAED